MLNAKALALTAGILGAVVAGGLVVVSLLTGYAADYLAMVGPLHPWYAYSYLGALILAVEHFVGCFIGGYVFGAVYNVFAK